MANDSNVWFRQTHQPSRRNLDPKVYTAKVELRIVAVSDRHAERMLERLLDHVPTSMRVTRERVDLTRDSGGRHG